MRAISEISAYMPLLDNGWVHRDVKSDNVLLTQKEDGLHTVLIDFSLTKLEDLVMYGKADTLPVEGTSHTGEVGTATYMAPEIVAKTSYGKPSDIWSAGVVLLELLLDQELSATKNRVAHQMIAETLDGLPDQPFPDLLRGMLQANPADRFSAMDALKHPVFEKFGFEIPKKRIIDPHKALALEGCDGSGDTEERPAKHATKQKKDPVLERRLKTIKKALTEIGCANVLTVQAAMQYCQQLVLLDDELDDLSSSQSLLDCVVLAHRFFEVEVADLEDLDSAEKGLFSTWSLDQYVDNEATIFMLMDYCLYPRSLV